MNTDDHYSLLLLLMWSTVQLELQLMWVLSKKLSWREHWY
jgi:hypothetical protein